MLENPVAGPSRAVRFPVMFQGWEAITFLHWRYDANAIQKKLPSGLNVDVFDGTGWIGLTPFRIANLRAPLFPPLPWISYFPETNLRTYVRGPDGEPGIWFFTLEAARLLAVLGAQLFYGLPYRWAEMSVSLSDRAVEYNSRRIRPLRPAHTRIRIGIRERIRTTDIEAFLTARFRLYTILAGCLAFADVQHEEWQLRKADVLELNQDLSKDVGLGGLEGDPIAHYSPGVHVRIGSPQISR